MNQSWYDLMNTYIYTQTHWVGIVGCLNYFNHPLVAGRLLFKLDVDVMCLSLNILHSFVPCYNPQALAVTKDGRYVITGGFDCIVNVFTAHNMKLKHSHERFDSSIRSLHISDDQK